MIVLKLIGHEYLNEVSDIIKLFYGKESIKLCSDSENIASQEKGIFITSNIIINNNETFFQSLYLDTSNDEKDEYTAIENGISLSPKETKKALKISMYKLLSRVTGKELPWGVLTGIRPVKIVHKLFDKGMQSNDIVQYLRDEYYVSLDRALLSIKVALTEKKYIKEKNRKKVSIYVGIPFCPSRCNYCSFTSNSIDKNKDLVKPYLDAMMTEIRQVSQYLKSKGVNVQSIYIGGGTPTSINAEELGILLECINESWYDNEEFTCEAGRPDTITAEKLKVIKDAGVTRLSINPQTMDDETLVRIGRKHNHYQIIECFHLARSLGFDNINMDMILGLPGENLKHVENTLEWIKRMNPENVTVHTMAIKRASVYNEINPNLNGYSDDLVSKMMELSKKSLEGFGYHPYYLYRQKHMAQNLENIGYCKKDKECIYNIQIMEEKQSIVAFGADAVTKAYFQEEDRLERQHNIKDLKLYIENIDNQIHKKLELLKFLTQ